MSCFDTTDALRLDTIRAFLHITIRLIELPNRWHLDSVYGTLAKECADDRQLGEYDLLY